MFEQLVGGRGRVLLVLMGVALTPRSFTAFDFANNWLLIFLDNLSLLITQPTTELNL